MISLPDQSSKMINIDDILNLDLSSLLDSPEMIMAYLDSVLEDKDPELLKAAIKTISQSPALPLLIKGNKGAKDTLQSLTVNSTQPFFEFADKVCEALGFRLGVQPITT